MIDAITRDNISLVVEGQSIRVDENTLFVSGSVGCYTAKFEFCERWNNLTKTAVFSTPSVGAIEVPLDADNTCCIPWEVLQEETRQLKVGVYGTKDGVIYPTISTHVVVTRGTQRGASSQPPTPTVYDQLLDRFSGVEKAIADNAEAIADNTEARHTHTNQEILDELDADNEGQMLFKGNLIKTSASNVKYNNPKLADDTHTVKGALDEAVGFVLTSVPALQEQVDGKQPKGDYITEDQLNSRLENIPKGVSVQVVPALPTENIDESVIYLVSNAPNVLSTAANDLGNVYNGIGYKKNTKWHDSLGDVIADNVDITGYIPVNSGDVIYLKNVAISKTDTSYPCILLFEDNDYWWVADSYCADNLSALSAVWSGDNLVSFTIPQSSKYTITHVRIQASNVNETSIISVNTEVDQDNAFTEYIRVGGAWEKVGKALTEEQVTAITDNTKARHTHSNKTVLDKFSVGTNNALQFDGKPVASGSTSISPKVTAAQTVAVLLENTTTSAGGLVHLSMESADVANSPDSDFQTAISNLFLAAEFGGDVLIYTPPETGVIEFVDPNNDNEMSVNVVLGTIYVFFPQMDDEGNVAIKYNTPYGKGIRDLLINGVTF